MFASAEVKDWVGWAGTCHFLGDVVGAMMEFSLFKQLKMQLQQGYVGIG
jgi:hypothetical protein